VAQKLQRNYKNSFDSAPYTTGRSSSVKSLCSKTELKLCTTAEIRWNSIITIIIIIIIVIIIEIYVVPITV